MQSLQYKNLCKAVWVEARDIEQTKTRGKEHYNKSEITQGTDTWKLVILSYCAVVL